MIQYSWFIWSLLLLVIWLVVYFSLRDKTSKKEMLSVSLWTSLLGLTEPIFVPEYWMPPSLFDLAKNTGFDIESLIFAFGVGGLSAVIYEFFFKVKHQDMTEGDKQHKRHKYHFLSLISAPIIFLFLLLFSDLNPIYSTFIALIMGGLFTWYCRPDLKTKMIASAFIFTLIYFIYFSTLEIVFPGYVSQVWNFSEISGILIFSVPLEELMFAFGLGFLWSSIYEHTRWISVRKN